MNVKELKEFIKDLPDDCLIKVVSEGVNMQDIQLQESYRHYNDEDRLFQVSLYTE